MDWCIVDPETNIITNRIVCDDPKFAKKLGAVKDYPGAAIGSQYDPDGLIALKEENKVLKSQVEALSTQSDFYEECLVEMATIVYA